MCILTHLQSCQLRMHLRYFCLRICVKMSISAPITKATYLMLSSQVCIAPLQDYLYIVLISVTMVSLHFRVNSGPIHEKKVCSGVCPSISHTPLLYVIDLTILKRYGPFDSAIILVCTVGNI